MERNHQQDQQQQPSQQRMKPPEAQNHHQPPPPQKCPRCDSSNTKFCYYNNYSLSQPRYFCKACRRYWTQGGTLRNVPVGGGCRKSKRPKPSIPSSSSSEIGGRTQSSSPAPPPQNLTDMSPGHGFRPLPPGMSSMGHTFYTGGSFMSSLVAMQNLPAGINQGAAANLGGRNSNYDPNMAVLQGFQPLKPQPPQQFQVQNHDQYFPSHQGSLSIPTRPSLTSWTQNFINRGPPATSSAASSGFWTESADGGGGGGNQAGSSLNPSHWQENNPGFDPSQ